MIKKSRVDRSSRKYVITNKQNYEFNETYRLISYYIEEMKRKERKYNDIKFIIITKSQIYLELYQTIKIEIMLKYFTDENFDIRSINQKATEIAKIIQEDYLAIPEIYIVKGKMASYQKYNTKLLIEGELSHKEIEELLYKIY